MNKITNKETLKDLQKEIDKNFKITNLIIGVGLIISSFILIAALFMGVLNLKHMNNIVNNLPSKEFIKLQMNEQNKKFNERFDKLENLIISIKQPNS